MVLGANVGEVALEEWGTFIVHAAARFANLEFSGQGDLRTVSNLAVQEGNGEIHGADPEEETRLRHGGQAWL